LLLIPSLAAAGAACSQAVDPGTTDGGAAVQVQYGTESKSVDLASLTPATVEGNTGARVSEVIAAAFPSARLPLIGADFIAPDGFRPAAKSGCRTLIPVTGGDLEQGVLDPQSANLLWAPSLGFGGCMGVRGVAKILVVDLSDSGPMFAVRFGATAIDIDLRFQPATEVDGEPRIQLQNLVKSSGITDAPQTFSFDVEAADGTRPGAGPGATLLTWEQLAHGTLHAQTRELAFDAAAGLSAVWNVTEARALILVP
jgi:hypothetical protein